MTGGGGGGGHYTGVGITNYLEINHSRLAQTEPDVLIQVVLINKLLPTFMLPSLFKQICILACLHGWSDASTTCN